MTSGCTNQQVHPGPHSQQVHQPTGAFRTTRSLGAPTNRSSNDHMTSGCTNQQEHAEPHSQWVHQPERAHGQQVHQPTGVFRTTLSLGARTGAQMTTRPVGAPTTRGTQVHEASRCTNQQEHTGPHSHIYIIAMGPSELQLGLCL